MKPHSYCALALCLLIDPASAERPPSAPNPNLPLDRNFTLRNQEPLLLEREYGRMARGSPLTFILPRPCLSELDSSRVCGYPHGFAFADSSRDRSISVSPQMGLGYRRIGEHTSSVEGGVLASGHSGALSFYLDARMYSEFHQRFSQPSWDREYMERQDASNSGTVAYTSYSRYRGHVAYDLTWGRITAGRDAVHWGPGLYHNLSFSQDAIPFRNLAYSTSLGPFSIISLYGILLPTTDWESDLSRPTRSIYAHRYEWRAGRNWLLGISEQLVLHDAEAPFAFLPVVPLYVAKSEESEAFNNGNIAGDLTWRAAPGLRFYGEFFLDDLQSPTSLFDDHWGNKWACMAGVHGVWDGPFEGGAVAEWSRVEPWVYTHYRANTSQTANFDHPLGNQAGPNSQSATLKAYSRTRNAWYLSARVDLMWKGTDTGSAINDENFPLRPLRKEFLAGVGKPTLLVTPSAEYRWRRISAGLQATFSRRTTIVARVQATY